MTIDFGLDIIASADSEARSRRAFYPVVTDGSRFTISVGFTSWTEREGFNKWLANFMRSVSEGSAKHGTMTVRCPNRNFVRVGVPQGPVVYGEGIRDVAYTTDLAFVGATDPVDITVASKLVSALQPKSLNASNRFFYPTGQQIKGAESLEGTLFDPTPTGTDPTTPSLPSPTPYNPAQQQKNADQLGDLGA